MGLYCHMCLCLDQAKCKAIQLTEVLRVWNVVKARLLSTVQCSWGLYPWEVYSCRRQSGRCELVGGTKMSRKDDFVTCRDLSGTGRPRSAGSQMCTASDREVCEAVIKSLSVSMEQSPSWEGSLPHSQQPATCPCRKPDWSSSCPHPTSRRSILMLSSHLRLSLSGDLLFSVFSTTTPYAPLLFPIHATCLPISFLILSPKRYVMGSTKHKYFCYAVLINTKR